MKTTRRQFLKSLLATAATAAIAPQVLVESVHGASDLSAHERDAVANALGLGQKQWRGVGIERNGYPPHWFDALGYYAEDIAQQNIHAALSLHPGEQTVLIKTNAPPEHVNCRCIRRVQVPVLVPGDSLFSSVELDVSEQEPLTEERVQSAFVRLCAERAVERDQQILWGRPGGQMPVGVLGADEIDEIWKQAGEERPAMLHRYPTLDNFGITSSAVRDRIALLRATTGCDGGDAFRQAILEQAEQNLYDSEPKII